MQHHIFLQHLTSTTFHKVDLFYSVDPFLFLKHISEKKKVVSFAIPKINIIEELGHK